MKELQNDKKTGEIKNFALPEQVISREDFLRYVREAEEGPFMTVEEAMLNFEEWINEREG